MKIVAYFLLDEGLLLPRAPALDGEITAYTKGVLDSDLNVARERATVRARFALLSRRMRRFPKHRAALAALDSQYSELLDTALIAARKGIARERG